MMIKRIRFGVTALVGVVTLIALVVSCGSPENGGAIIPH